MTYKPAINAEILDRLFDVVESRKGSDADASYTAKLLAAGTPKIAQKVGEEAVSKWYRKARHIMAADAFRRQERIVFGKGERKQLILKPTNQSARNSRMLSRKACRSIRITFTWVLWRERERERTVALCF